MILTKVDYFENKNKPNFWQIKNVILGQHNIFVGLNATGKSRLLNVINNLAKILTQKIRRNGNWDLEFLKNKGSKVVYKYELRINNLIIDCEKIYENGTLILDREKEKGTIFSKKTNETEEYSPPIDELTINIRRDLEHYPFLEDIINWAKELLGYTFSGVQTNLITVPMKPEGLLTDLNAVPYLLLESMNDENLINKIVEDLNEIGYSVEKVGARKQSVGANLGEVSLVSIKELDLKCTTEQGVMSQGMFRALSLIVILEHIVKHKISSTIVIDDLGEGLDFERSSKLTRLLFERTKGTNIQLIVTSNDRFLINAVDLKNINFLKRQGPNVEALNYSNNKELFDKFILTGLNNFDFLSTKLDQLKN